MKKGILLLSALAAIAFTSCDALKSTSKEKSTKTEKVTDTELSNKLEGTWTLSFLDPTLSGAGSKTLKDLFPNKMPQLTFDTTKHFVNGNNGCNNVFGPYFLSGKNDITLGDKWGTTLMMCTGVSDFAFSNAISKINKYDIQGDKLHLMISDIVVMTLTKDTSATDVKLAGTKWELSFIQPLDRSAKTLPMRFSHKIPTIEINADSFTGNGGCNSLSGTFASSSNTIKFDKIAMTRMFCEGVEENLFVDNLSSSSKFKIENEELVLSNNDDMVLLRFKKK